MLSTPIKIIKMPIREYMCLFTPKAGYDNTTAYVVGISEEEEQELLKNNKVTLTKDNKTFDIMLDHCFCYGNINFSSESDDLDTIKESGLFNNYDIQYVLYANYDYETHTCKTELTRPKWYDSWDIKDILQYIHGCLGKPNHVVIFKESNAKTKRITTTNKSIRKINPDIIKKRKAMKAMETKEKQRQRINRLILKLK